MPNNHESNKVYAPIGVLCQSSGHGKSRCMRQFSKTHFAVYLALRTSDDHTYPSKSNASDLFLDHMQQENTSIIFLRSLVNASLNIIESIKNQKHDSNYEEFNLFQPWNNDENNQKIKDFFEKLQEEIELNRKVTTESLIKDIGLKFEKVLANETLFIFLDEGNSLLAQSNVLEEFPSSKHYISKYKVLRRATQKLFKNIRITFLGKYSII